MDHLLVLHFMDQYSRFAIHPHRKLNGFLSHLVGKYNGGRFVIESIEENGDYGLSDLYEINKNDKKIDDQTTHFMTLDHRRRWDTKY